MTAPEDNASTEAQREIDRIVAEYCRNRQVPLEELLLKHPEHADELKSRLSPLVDCSEAPTVISNPLDQPTSHPPGDGSYSDRLPAEAKLGDFQLIRKLGQGGMGIVYQAEHTKTERPLAVKLLSPDLPHSEETSKRFLNEASLAASLSHPRTTFVYEAGEEDGNFYIAMELMPGRTLQDIVREQGPLPVQRAVDYIIDVLEGLDAAHRVGVIHRDVKPSNCFLDDEGRVKIGDFGLSKSLVSESELTRTGAYLGTPQFSAPEQIRGTELDHRTDLFSAAATLYYLIAGEAPFRGDPAAVIAQIVADAPPSLHEKCPGVPKALSKVVARALEKDPKQRGRDVSEFRNALLPFGSTGTSMAAVGRRLAAFFIDVLLTGTVVGVVSAAYSVVAAVNGVQSSIGNLSPAALVSFLIVLPYFAISEGVFGRSLGKQLLGLRVVDAFGEPPGLMRSFLRVLILPGLTWVSIDMLLHQAKADNFDPGSGSDFTAWNAVVRPQLLVLAKFALTMIICSTMRRKNGLRGIHEFASGTRVVRFATVDDTVELEAIVPTYTPVRHNDLPKVLGTFTIEGMLSADPNMTVLSARDNTLDRRAWIYRPDRSDAISPDRIRVARSTRQRWLQDGEDENGRWHAFEAFEGAPISEAARFTTIPWPVGRRVLLETAEELRASISDGTLPNQLTVSQVWIDERGDTKLLDFPLSPPGAPTNRSFEDNATDNATKRATEQLCQVSEFCTQDERTPGVALDLVQEMRRDEGNKLTLSAVAGRLRDLAKHPFRMRWDDRLGVLAISIVVESVFFVIPALAAGILLGEKSAIPILGRILLAGTCGMILPLVLGYFLRGGLAFWLTKTAVRDRMRAPASRLRCAWRSAIAWSPIVFIQGTLGAWLFAVTQLDWVDGNLTVDTAAERQFGVISMTIGAFMIALGIALLVGIICTIIQPRRGVQDLLAGTYLVRK